MENSFERNELYLKRALNSSKGSVEQKKYAKLALAEYDACEKIQIFNPGTADAGNVEITVHFMYMRSVMMAMTDQPEETIKVTTKTLSLTDKYPDYLDFHQIREVKSAQAEAYSELGKWEEAVKIYQGLVIEFEERGTFPDGDMIAGMCRALYEQHEYHAAIKIGTYGTNHYRSAPGIRKYLALSQKALGNIDEANITISRAILYEQQWNKDNLEQNKQILRELNNH